MELSGEEPSQIDVFAMYRRELFARPLLTAQQKVEINHKIMSGTKEEKAQARQELVENNLRLVLKYAQQYATFGIPIMDLIQEGNIGLMKAAKRYDPTRGNEFSTMAIWWIRQKIQRFVNNFRRTVRLPVYQSEVLRKYQGALNGLEQELGRKPTDQEVADRMGVALAHVAEAKVNSSTVMSLDEPVNDEDDSGDSDLYGVDYDPSAIGVEDYVERKIMLEQVKECIEDADLPSPRIRQILRARIGLNGSEDLETPQTLKKLGERMDVTRERIRQQQREGANLLKPQLAKIIKLDPKLG